MKEETNKPNGELNDAALEQVSGGVTVLSGADVLKACEICPSRTSPISYSCAYGGGDPEELAAELRHVMGSRCPLGFSPVYCPYLKRL